MEKKQFSDGQFENMTDFNCDLSILVYEAVKLMEHPMTRSEINRHLKVINEFLENSKCVYYVQHLPCVIRLLELLAEKSETVPQYKLPLERLLNICSIPPVLIKSSDVLEYFRDLQEYFSVFGYLLVSLEHCRKIITSVLNKLLNNHPLHSPPCVSLRVCIEAAQDSQLPYILGQLLAIVDEDIYADLLKIIIPLIKTSDKVCEKLLKSDVIIHVITRLECTWKIRYPSTPPKDSFPSSTLSHYEDTSDIIWLVFKYLSKHRNIINIIHYPTQFSLWSLQYTLKYLTKMKIKPIDRNNVVAMILKMLELFPNIDFVNSGLALDITLLILATNGDKHKKSGYFWTNEIHFLPNKVNFDLLKMLLMCIPYYLDHYYSLRILENKMVVGSLLKLVKGTQTTNWPPHYHRKLIILTMVILTKIVPALLEDFMEHNGPSVLLNIIKEYETDLEVINITLEAIIHLTRIVENNIQESLVFNNGIQLISGLCNTFLLKDFLTPNDQNCLGSAFCILEIFCKYFRSQMNEDVSEICLKYIKRILKPQLNELLPNNKVIICFINFLWTSMLLPDNNYFCVKHFIDNGGVYLLLDIIQNCDFPVKLITFGVLVDLCEERSSIPYLITWRGGGQNLMVMLMKIFREENKNIGVKSGPNGEIIDTDFAIMGHDQWRLITSDTKNTVGYPVISDLFLSCRPKIYAILHLLNDKFNDTVEIANEVYKLYDDKLNPHDEVTLLLAENFLALKLCEAWEELKIELDKINIRPTIVDGEIIEYLLERKHRWSKHLQMTQHKILLIAKKKGAVEEIEFYQELMEYRLSSAFHAVKELKFIAKCTENFFRISKKIVEADSVETSLHSMHRIHKLNRTYMPTFSITTLLNQMIDIESDVKNKEKCCRVPISPSCTTSVDVNCSEDCLEILEPTEENCC